MEMSFFIVIELLLHDLKVSVLPQTEERGQRDDSASLQVKGQNCRKTVFNVRCRWLQDITLTVESDFWYLFFLLDEPPYLPITHSNIQNHRR